jgi:hypothetical protein
LQRRAAGIIREWPGLCSPSSFAVSPRRRKSRRRPATLREALDAAFRVNPRLRGYVLDDQGHLRPNVVAFIDGRRSRDRVAQSDPLAPDSRVHVMQALSGG